MYSNRHWQSVGKLEGRSFVSLAVLTEWLLSPEQTQSVRTQLAALLRTASLSSPVHLFRCAEFCDSPGTVASYQPMVSWVGTWQSLK